MKQIVKLFCIAAMMCVCVSADAQDLKDILGGVLKNAVGDKATTEQSIIGTWQYVGPECQFDSE